MLVGCFLIIKVLAAKIFFKPYKATQYYDREIDTLKNKQVFKENCLSMGFTLIALMTDYVFKLFSKELASQGLDLTLALSVSRVKGKIFDDLTPIAPQEEVTY